MKNDVKDEKHMDNTSPPTNRKQLKAEKAEVQNKKTWWVQIRLFPIWLRIILIISLLVGAIAAGLMIGYGYIGDGTPKDILKLETWQHIIDIYSGKE